MTYAGAQNLKSLKNNSFEVSFMHLYFRRKHKEDYMEVEKSKVGTG